MNMASVVPPWIFYLTAISTGCSILHSFLPPWDADVFEPFPTFQKYYKVFIYILGYVAVNMRSTVYTSISTQKTGGVNESIANSTKGEKE